MSAPTRRLRARLAPLARGFSALGIRSYLLYWTGQLAAFIGRWMQTTAQAWLVIELTRSPLAIGLVTTVQFLPTTLLSLFGGVIADRFPKHRLILVMQLAALAQGALFGALIAWGHITIELVYILAGMQGIINAIDNPVRQTFVSEIVTREQLPNAVALGSMQFNIARIIGPAIAGLVIAQVGIAPAFFIGTAGFAAAAIQLLRMPDRGAPHRPGAATGSPWRQLVDGLAYTWRTPAVLLVMIVVAAIGTFGYNFTVVLPLLAGFVLKTDAAGLGTISAALGLGSLIGAVGTTYARRITPQRLLVAAGMFSLLLGATAMTTSFWLACALLLTLGIFGVTFATTANTLLQLTVPDALRGRVISLYVLLFVGSTPLGALLIGSVSSALGTPAALLICALICLLGVGVGAWYARRLPPAVA